MATILLESQSETDINLLLTLAQKLGIKTRKLSAQQAEDHWLASQIDEGMKTPPAPREAILQLLEP